MMILLPILTATLSAVPGSGGTTPPPDPTAQTITINGLPATANGQALTATNTSAS